MNGRLRFATFHAVVAGCGAAVVAWLGPPGDDLAAHVYQRSFLLDHGFALWNNYWYAGRYSFVTYSLAYYPLAATVGIKVLAIASVAVTAFAFKLIVDAEWPSAGPWPARAFTVVSALTVLGGAFPYALGLALSLLALLALQRHKARSFAALVVASFAASPLAFALLAIVLAATFVARRTPRLGLLPLAAVAATAAAAVVLWRAFPSVGHYPFPRAELAAALVFCGVGFAFTWRVTHARVLGYVFVTYAIACVAAFAVPSAVGENVARLRFVALPIALLAVSLRGWKPLAPAIVAVALAASWNLTPLAFSYARNASDPAARQTYWRPVITFLSRRLSSNYRVEAVGTAGHWEAAYLPRAGIPLARGWFRQDDFPENRVLYEGLTPTRYIDWLHRLGVIYVVLTNAPLDYSARSEAALLRSGASRLEPIARLRHATIYAVPHATGIVTGAPGARVVALRTSSITVALPSAGRYRLAVRYAPYWTADAACVERGPAGMTELVARHGGRFRLKFEVTASRALATLVGARRRCR